jgi:hypothetical protein
LTISDKIITKDHNPVLTNKHTDWDYFNHLLKSNINLSVPLKTADQLEWELNAFTTAIQEAAWNSTPVIKTKLKGLNFPKEIRNFIAEKRKLRRKWHQSRNPRDKNLLNRASQQLSKEIKTIKQSPINKFLTELTQDSSSQYSVWKATKYLKRPIAQVPPIKKTDGRWARNNLEEANTFAQHLEKRFHPYPGLGILPVLNSNDYLGKIPLVTSREVAEEIRTNLNPKKHLDLISSQGKFLRTLKEKPWSN